MKQATCILMLFTLFIANSAKAQELKTVKEISIDELPEYVIIQSQNTKLLGGIAMTIDFKNSEYKDALIKLQGILEKSSNLKVRNQIDLLNAMSKLGFDYLNAYLASAFTEADKYSKESTDSFGGDTYRVNMVFRKKDKFRN